MTAWWRQVFTADDPRGPWPARVLVRWADQVPRELREKFAASDEWSEMCDLQYKVTELPDGPDRLIAFWRVAELLDSYAGRMERSGLVRALSSSFSPDQLRAEAAEYRAGRDPHV